MWGSGLRDLVSAGRGGGGGGGRRVGRGGTGCLGKWAAEEMPPTN